MFYQGTLQEGISTAVGQQKLVLCFVTNENEESQTWENDYLQDATLKDVVTKQAVALRLMAGSEEAGYLAQIFPLPQTPTIVIMKHGELKEYIAAGTTKEDFLRRVRGSFEGATAVPSAAPETLTESPPPSSQQQQQQQSAASNVASSPSTVERSDAVQRVLEDRAAKLQAAKEAAERKAREEREEQKARPATPASKQAQEQAELVRKSKQQATEERRRILRRIQDDKDERRKRAQDREQQQRLERQASSQTSSPLATPLRSERSPVTQAGAFTSVQVRLLDGSTIRSRFETASPVKEVRKWVEEKTPDVRRTPFGFKQLLTPLPNRSIDETEEEKSFGDLGLSPSSTLILVPIRSYATAYNDPSQGILSRVLGLAMDFFLWVAGVFGVGGGGGEGGGADASNNASGSSSSSSSKQTEDAEPSTGAASSTAVQTKKGNVKRLEDTRDRLKDQQLYNGNSLNFEPRPDEDEKS